MAKDCLSLCHVKGPFRCDQLWEGIGTFSPQEWEGLANDETACVCLGVTFGFQGVIALATLNMQHHKTLNISRETLNSKPSIKKAFLYFSSRLVMV